MDSNEKNMTMDDQIKKLEKTLDDLYSYLAWEKPGTDAYKQIVQAIESVNHRIANLNEKSKMEKEREINLEKVAIEEKTAKTNNVWTAVKVIGTLALGVIGLGLAHKDDIGDTIPGKYVSKFVDTVIFRKL